MALNALKSNHLASLGLKWLKSSVVPLLNFLIWGEELWTAMFGLKTLETSPYRAMCHMFRYTEPFRRGSPVWQTDRRTDGQNRDCNSVRLTTRAKIMLMIILKSTYENF